MTDPSPFTLRVTGPAERQLVRLPENVAVAIVEFVLGALIENPRRVGGSMQRELAGFHSARRGAYRVVYEILDDVQLVVVHPSITEPPRTSRVEPPVTCLGRTYLRSMSSYRIGSPLLTWKCRCFES